MSDPQQSQQWTNDITDLEYAKFRQTADNKSAVAVVPVSPVVPSIGGLYDSAEFTVANGTSNYNVAANQAAAFSRVTTAQSFVLRIDQPVTINLNTTSDPAITVQTIDSPFQLTTALNNLFITNNSGSTVNVKLILLA